MPDGRGRLSLPTWMGKLNIASSYAALQARVLPLVMEYPWTQTYRVTYRLPAGASADVPAPVAVHSAFGDVTRTAASDGRQVTIEITVTLVKRRIEPGEYPDFRNFCKQADQVGDERLRVRLAGGQP